MKSVKETIAEAKINRETYYKAFKKEGFRKLYKEEAMEIVRRAVAPMVNALVKEAKRGSAQHLKMGLEIGDIYTEKHEVVTETYADRIKRLRKESSGK